MSPRLVILPVIWRREPRRRSRVCQRTNKCSSWIFATRRKEEKEALFGSERDNTSCLHACIYRFVIGTQGTRDFLIRSFRHRSPTKQISRGLLRSATKIGCKWQVVHFRRQRGHLLSVAPSLTFINLHHGSTTQPTHASTTRGRSPASPARGQSTNHAGYDSKNGQDLFQQVCRNFGMSLSFLLRLLVIRIPYTKCFLLLKGDRLDSREQSCMASCQDQYFETRNQVQKALESRQSGMH
jgi:hypothetical protein